LDLLSQNFKVEEDDDALVNSANVSLVEGPSKLVDGLLRELLLHVSDFNEDLPDLLALTEFGYCFIFGRSQIRLVYEVSCFFDC